MHVTDWNLKMWNVILDTLAEAFQGEHETELFDALEDTYCGPGRKKGERLHDYDFWYKATYESWPNREYGCQKRCREFFCCVERT